MIPEYGHFALILALCLALMQMLLPAIGVFVRSVPMMATARNLAIGQCVFLSLSLLFLVVIFLQNDFSVILVANHSNTLLPAMYKVSAVWGNHEGSLLLWVWILSLWSIAVAFFSRSLPLDMVARVLSVMAAISVGFLLFLLLTSNPFERELLNTVSEGGDLNPLLQDIGLIIHPPILYAGYVGFAVAFAFAIAALSSGRLDAAWARWSRPWTNAAWAFLTVGIALGSWWAYYELGWGGWWFWDPVENASFMPWIVGTALMHSLAVTEKRGTFKSWTVLLAIFCFSLSLLGTFLVRSGVLTSVHSFAADPERGIFILAFLGVVVGGSLTLYAFKAPSVVSRQPFSLLSRELFLLLNNVILLVAMLTVLFGTLFPLFMDALGYGKYSVGPPYFNAVFVPLMALLFVFMGLGPGSLWKQTSASYLRSRIMMALVVSLLVGALFPLFYGQEYNFYAAIAVCFGLWLILSVLGDLQAKLRASPSVSQGLRQLSLSYYGMVVAHIGMGVCALGVCLTSQYNVERDLRMAPGDIAEMAGMRFEFLGSKPIKGPNYEGDEGLIVVSNDKGEITRLMPQKRRYFAQQGQVMTEADIDAGLFRDIFVAMGEPLAQGAWAVRLHYKPFVRWMWLGALLMAFGAFMAAADKRYRQSPASR